MLLHHAREKLTDHLAAEHSYPDRKSSGAVMYAQNLLQTEPTVGTPTVKISMCALRSSGIRKLDHLLVYNSIVCVQESFDDITLYIACKSFMLYWKLKINSITSLISTGEVTIILKSRRGRVPNPSRCWHMSCTFAWSQHGERWGVLIAQEELYLNMSNLLTRKTQWIYSTDKTWVPRMLSLLDWPRKHDRLEW